MVRAARIPATRTGTPTGNTGTRVVTESAASPARNRYGFVMIVSAPSNNLARKARATHFPLEPGGSKPQATEKRGVPEVYAQVPGGATGIGPPGQLAGGGGGPVRAGSGGRGAGARTFRGLDAPGGKTDLEVSGAHGDDLLPNRLLAPFGRPEHQTAPSSGSADLGGAGARPAGPLDQLLDPIIADGRRKGLPGLPLFREGGRRAVPVGGDQRGSDRMRRGDHPIESGADASIPVQVPFHHVPVRDAGRSRPAGIDQNDPSPQRFEVDRQPLDPRTFDA